MSLLLAILFACDIIEAANNVYTIEIHANQIDIEEFSVKGKVKKDDPIAGIFAPQIPAQAVPAALPAPNPQQPIAKVGATKEPKPVTSTGKVPKAVAAGVAVEQDDDEE